MLELDPLKKTCANCDLYCTYGNKCPELPHMPHDACDKWIPTHDYNMLHDYKMLVAAKK